MSSQQVKSSQEDKHHNKKNDWLGQWPGPGPNLNCNSNQIELRLGMKPKYHNHNPRMTPCKASSTQSVDAGHDRTKSGNYNQFSLATKFCHLQKTWNWSEVAVAVK